MSWITPSLFHIGLEMEELCLIELTPPEGWPEIWTTPRNMMRRWGYRKSGVLKEQLAGYFANKVLKNSSTTKGKRKVGSRMVGYIWNVCSAGKKSVQHWITFWHLSPTICFARRGSSVVDFVHAWIWFPFSVWIMGWSRLQTRGSAWKQWVM